MKTAPIRSLSIRLSGLALAAQTAWEQFIEDLEETHPDLGPVLSWGDDEATHALVVLSVHERSGAMAAAQGVAAIAESLDRTGQGHIYPARIDVCGAILS